MCARAWKIENSIIMMKDALTSPVSPPQAVCGRTMTADINCYPCSEYQGQHIYFCTEFCLEAFNADQDRFYAAHRSKKDERKPEQAYQSETSEFSMGMKSPL
jgi:YHS domain-containing protein